MQIILYDPPVKRSHSRWDDVVNTPLSSCLITGYTAASLLSHGGHHIEIVETGEGGSFPDNSLLALHLVYQWEETERLMHSIKELKKNGAIHSLFVYGLFPTVFYEELLRRYPFIDGVIVGEPETTLTSLSHRIQDRQPWKETRGVAHRKNGQTVFRSRPPLHDLDRLSFPLRQGLAQGTAYLLGSRGCYGRCSFCTINSLYGEDSQWRGRSPENIVQEMVQVRRKFGDPYFYFADANFFGPGKHGKERVSRLSRLIRQELPGIRFGLECRADNVELELFTGLRKAGLKDVFLGVESFSQSALRRFHKGSTPEQNARAVKILQHLNLSLSLGFIMFDMNTTLEEVRTNFDTLRELNLLTFPSSTAHLLSHRVFLLKGSPFFRNDSNKEYEAGYEFTDPRVKELYNLILPLCRKIIREMKGIDFEDFDPPHHSRTNGQLIRTFDEILCTLERVVSKTT